MHNDIILFALNSSREAGEEIATSLEISLSNHEERDFADGEHKARPLINVRNQDVFVVQSLHGDDHMSVNDKLCRLLFFISTLKEDTARSVTVLIPYLCYARKDRQTKPRDPVTTKYVARLLEASGVDTVMTMDVHNLQAFQNAFRCRTEHLEAKNLFVHHFEELAAKASLAVMSPDFGGAKRAEQFREALGTRTEQNIPLILMEKQRSQGVVSGDTLVGEVNERTVIIIDDMISSGGTLVRAARAAKAQGAQQVIAAATHGVFIPEANENLPDEALDRIVVTNTVPITRLNAKLQKSKVEVIDALPLFAKALQCLRIGSSVEELLEHV